MPCTALAVGLQGEVVLDMLHEVSPGVKAAPGHQLRAVLPADGGGRVPVQQEYYLLRLMCILRESSLTHLKRYSPVHPGLHLEPGLVAAGGQLHPAGRTLGRDGAASLAVVPGHLLAILILLVK